MPTPRRYMDSTLVPVLIDFRDKALRELAKSVQGKWDPGVLFVRPYS
jgi:hypothetical protein